MGQRLLTLDNMVCLWNIMAPICFILGHKVYVPSGQNKHTYAQSDWQTQNLHFWSSDLWVAANLKRDEDLPKHVVSKASGGQLYFQWLCVYIQKYCELLKQSLFFVTKSELCFSKLFAFLLPKDILPLYNLSYKISMYIGRLSKPLITWLFVCLGESNRYS